MSTDGFVSRTQRTSLADEVEGDDRSATSLPPPAAGTATTARPSASPVTRAALTEHLHLVHRIVAQFMRRLPRSVQREDLVAAGSLGLFHALRASSHTCDEMFASYARIRIRGAIVDELRRHDWAPRRRQGRSESGARLGAPEPGGETGSSLAPSNVVAIGTARRAHPGGGGSGQLRSGNPPHNPSPSEGEAAAIVRIAVVGFDDLPPHMQARVEMGTSSASASSDDASPLAQVEEKYAFEALHGAVAELPAREATIIRMRYFEGMASKAIASALGLSEARISQLHARATARLRELLSGSTEIDLAA